MPWLRRLVQSEAFHIRGLTRAQDLLDLVNGNELYDCIPANFSGFAALESVLGALAPSGRKRQTLVAAAGPCGAETAGILEHLKRPHQLLGMQAGKPVSTRTLIKALDAEADVQTVVLSQLDTTTGVVSPVEELAGKARAAGKTVVVDARHGLGALPLDLSPGHVDALISVPWAALGGVPGFSFIIVRRDLLGAKLASSPSAALDLFAPQFDLARRTGALRENARHRRALGKLRIGEVAAVPGLVPGPRHVQVDAVDSRHFGEGQGERRGIKVHARAIKTASGMSKRESRGKCPPGPVDLLSRLHYLEQCDASPSDRPFRPSERHCRASRAGSGVFAGIDGVRCTRGCAGAGQCSGSGMRLQCSGKARRAPLHRAHPQIDPAPLPRSARHPGPHRQRSRARIAFLPR